MVSIGLNSFNPKSNSKKMERVLGFISAADKVLYEAKGNGHNRLVFAAQ